MFFIENKKAFQSTDNRRPPALLPVRSTYWTIWSGVGLLCLYSEIQNEFWTCSGGGCDRDPYGGSQGPVQGVRAGPVPFTKGAGAGTLSEQ